MKKVKAFITVVVVIACIGSVSAQEYGSHRSSHYKKSNSLNKVKRSQVTYANKRPKIRAERSLPNAKPVTYNHQRLNYQKGKYYRNVRGGYVSVAPPRGLRISVLPIGHIQINIGSHRYYEYQGVYYKNVPGRNEYIVVDAPRDAIVYTLPEDAEKVYIDGKKYYESYGILYKVVTTPDGKAFKVVGEIEDY